MAGRAFFFFFFFFLLLLATVASSAAPTKSAAAPSSSTTTASAPTSTPTTKSKSKSKSKPLPSSSPSPSPSPSPSSSLDPKQVRALESLGLPTSGDPCSHPNLLCDNSKPFRHLVSLTLSNCSSDVSLSTTALKSLSPLQHLLFLNCPVAPIHFPPELTSSLRSFTCIHSLRRLTCVWLGKLQNLTDLTVSGVPVSSSGPTVFLGNLKKLNSVTISQANLTGYLPKSWHHNITHLDLSGNSLKGRIHSSLTALDNLVSLNLSSNHLSGEIPSSIGDLMGLKNLSLASNSLSGSIPDSLSAIPSLVRLDLSSNQLSGSIPGFIAEMKELNYLNLESNNLQGVMPFNASFIKRIAVFKIGQNTNLCYNHSTLSSSSSSKLKLGISPCDNNGLPMSPPPPKSTDDSDYSDTSDDSPTQKTSTSGGHHGPNKVVLGISISLASIVFLIIFLIFLSKWCA